ncbi:MAG: anaerobic ribonucleoside-triphosphate reductase activating protein [Bacilli bacterium]
MDNKQTLRVSSACTFDSFVDGEGIRSVVWTQGCTHHCPGCHNSGTHALDGGWLVDVDDVIEELRHFPLQDGVTLSGGEPFLQPTALIPIAAWAKNNEKDAWAYSGFTFEQLLDSARVELQDASELLRLIDVLVDGRYIERERDLRLPFRGSRNQRLIDVQASLAAGRVVEYVLRN